LTVFPSLFTIEAHTVFGRALVPRSFFSLVSSADGKGLWSFFLSLFPRENRASRARRQGECNFPIPFHGPFFFTPATFVFALFSRVFFFFFGWTSCLAEWGGHHRVFSLFLKPVPFPPRLLCPCQSSIVLLTSGFFFLFFPVLPDVCSDAGFSGDLSFSLRPQLKF